MKVDGAAASHGLYGDSPQSRFWIRHPKLLRIHLGARIAGRLSVPTIVPAAGTHQVQIEIVRAVVPRKQDVQNFRSLRYGNHIGPPLLDGDLTRPLPAGRAPRDRSRLALAAIAKRRCV